MVPAYDVRSTASRYSSCSPPTQRSTRLDRKQKKEYLASPWMTHVCFASNKPRWPYFLKNSPWRFSFAEATSSRKILFYSELSCPIHHQLHCHPSLLESSGRAGLYHCTLGSVRMICFGLLRFHWSRGPSFNRSIVLRHSVLSACPLHTNSLVGVGKRGEY